jgi:hypothetical protein
MLIWNQQRQIRYWRFAVDASFINVHRLLVFLAKPLEESF